jgi:exonuclease III
MSTSHWAVNLDSTLAVRARIDSPDLHVDILAGHLPHKRAQRPYFEALLNERELIEQPAIIIGDLNCGIPFEDSDTKTFDNTHMFQSLLKRGWTDSWRSRNPGAREFTWVSPRGNGYRYDHCLSTESMDSRISAIHYEHQLRESGLSDHSALLVEID